MATLDLCPVKLSANDQQVTNISKMLFSRKVRALIHLLNRYDTYLTNDDITRLLEQQYQRADAICLDLYEKYGQHNLPHTLTDHPYFWVQYADQLTRRLNKLHHFGYVERFRGAVSLPRQRIHYIEPITDPETLAAISDWRRDTPPGLHFHYRPERDGQPWRYDYIFYDATVKVDFWRITDKGREWCKTHTTYRRSANSPTDNPMVVNFIERLA